MFTPKPSKAQAKRLDQAKQAPKGAEPRPEPVELIAGTLRQDDVTYIKDLVMKYIRAHCEAGNPPDQVYINVLKHMWEGTLFEYLRAKGQVRRGSHSETSHPVASTALT